MWNLAECFAKNEKFRQFPDDRITFIPPSRSEAHQRRLLVQLEVTKQQVCCMFIWSLCWTK